MYDELAKQLRASCESCKLWDGYKCCLKGECSAQTRLQAADAIEKLQGELQALKGDTDMAIVEDGKETRLCFVKKWIPVTERLPEDEVLCINDRQFYLVGLLYCDDVGSYICETDGEIMYDVTHWMPLPQPPEEKNK